MTTAGRRRLVASAAALCALGLALAGCGGGSKTTATTTTTAAATTTTVAASGTALSRGAYDQKMAAIGRGLANADNALAYAQTPKETVAAYLKLQARLRLAEKQLKAITPPSGIAKQHAALTKAVEDFADELGPIIRKVAAGHILAGDVSKLPGVVELQAAAAAIQKAGYPIGA
jgi:hypothetical protein